MNAAEALAEYQVARKGEIIGQYDRARLLSLLNAGVLQHTDHYWHEGMQDWEPVTNLVGQHSSKGTSTPSSKRVLVAVVAATILGVAGALLSLRHRPAVAPTRPTEDGRALHTPQKAANEPTHSQTPEEYFAKGKDELAAGNSVEAADLFRKAAELGSAKAQFNFALSSLAGRGVPRDPEKAAQWFRKAAEQGDAEAQVNLGAHYFNGIGVPKDETEAVHWYRKAAEQGLMNAQFRLGVCLGAGIGMEKNDVEAANWFRKAAEQGDNEAQFNLGNCYDFGRGVAKDATKAVLWYRKAAEQGNVSAQFNLGQCYTLGEALGRGVPQDSTQAAKWYGKAAEQGHPEAQLMMGYLYEDGDGVAQDPTQAALWYRRASEQGHAVAQLNLGRSYDLGRGVARNATQAALWYRRAAERGVSDAQLNLGMCYDIGNGVPRDKIRAYYWLSLATAQDNENAKEWLTTLKVKMSVAQIAEAEKLAQNFRPRKALEPGQKHTVAAIEKSRPGFSGTGFFITWDGHLVTNHHVIEPGGQIRIVTSENTFAAHVVHSDEANDLIILKVEGAFPCLHIAPSSDVRLGSTVATVGFPNVELMGFAPKLSKGEIAGLSGSRDDPTKFQISVPLQPGNSGGALVDEQGSVVGVITSKLNAEAALVSSGSLPENVNYAVKSSHLLSILEALPELRENLRTERSHAASFPDVVEFMTKATVLVLVY